MPRGRMTLASHSHREIERRSTPVAPPISLASVHAFDDLDILLDAYHGKRSAYAFYRRFGHENGRQLEETMAALEGAEDALACSSGMSAVLTIYQTLLGKGGRVVASRDLYGGTYAYLRTHAPRHGVDVKFADLDVLEASIVRGVDLVAIETISNPLVRVPEFARIAKACRKAGALLVVDNTFATPFLCRPLEWGADVVFHSGTKFLNGHGDAVSGVIAASAERIVPMRKFASGLGTGISPMDAWLTLRGLKTLGLRVGRSSENAEKIAAFLARQRKVSKVYYPAPTRYLKPRRGAMLSFELRGGLRAAARFVKACRLIRLVPSLGDVTTTMTHPGRSSHAYLSPDERASLGVTDGLIRLSTGIEDLDDILGDLTQALSKT
jgi:methionine-gamma-lyase